MTETEWAECDRPDDMLQAVRERVANRKLLQFACGCLRLDGTAVPGGGLIAEMLEQIHAHKERTGRTGSIFQAISAVLPVNASVMIAQSLSFGGEDPWTLARVVGGLCRNAEPICRPQADLVRELLGDPFRFTFDPAWRSETVLGLAVTIETDRAWERMPILADALQDAGCDDDRVLDHCREDRRHFRGCWVVDGCLDR